MTKITKMQDSHAMLLGITLAHRCIVLENVYYHCDTKKSNKQSSWRYLWKVKLIHYINVRMIQTTKTSLYDWGAIEEQMCVRGVFNSIWKKERCAVFAWQKRCAVFNSSINILVEQQHNQTGNLLGEHQVNFKPFTGDPNTDLAWLAIQESG